MTSRDAAIRIVRTLREHGHEALLAGGCVRDRLLGRPAKDYDVATSAEPAAVRALFRRTLAVGAQFGVVIVLLGGQQIEVATFRVDGRYEDGRRPAEVRFATAREDAARRDFTVNGMFYDPLEDRVLDFVGGQADLAARRIRTIGAPEARFGEDHLRMLRALRFAAELGFTVEPETLAAIRAGAAEIRRISGERVHMELERLLAAPGRAEGLRLLWETNLAPVLWPGWDAAACDLARGILSHLRRAPSLVLGLAAVFACVPRDRALDSVAPLKLSRQERRALDFLLTHRGDLADPALSRADLRLLAAAPGFADLFAWERARQQAAGTSPAALIAVRRRLHALRGVPLTPVPWLTGDDLMGLGLAPGPELGRCIEALYRAQLEDAVDSRAAAEAWVARWCAREGGD